MEESLVDLLKAHTALTSLVGSNPARIYWMRAPQGIARPYLVMQIVSSIPDVTHGGPSGLIGSRVQIDCYGDTYASTKTTARAVTGRLSGFRGFRLNTTFDGIFKDAERDEYEESAAPDKAFRVSMDFLVWHKS